MRKASFIVLFLSLAFTVGVSAQQSDVSAERCCPPAAKMGADSKVSSAVRFDGMYFGIFSKSYSYLRFFDDGEVAAANFSEPRILSDLKRRHDQTRRSTYKIDGNKFTLGVFHTPTKEVFFEGTIEGNTITIDFDGILTVYTFVPETK